jgi:hypothetical protein
MRTSITLTNFSWSETGTDGLPREVDTVADAVDDIGIDSVFVADHLLQIEPGTEPSEPMLEAYTVLAYLAVRISRVQVGAMVSPASTRPLLVKAVTSPSSERPCPRRDRSPRPTRTASPDPHPRDGEATNAATRRPVRGRLQFARPARWRCPDPAEARSAGCPLRRRGPRPDTDRDDGQHPAARHRHPGLVRRAGARAHRARDAAPRGAHPGSVDRRLARRTRRRDPRDHALDQPGPA